MQTVIAVMSAGQVRGVATGVVMLIVGLLAVRRGYVQGYGFAGTGVVIFLYALTL